MRDTVSVEEAEARVAFLSTMLKVQLAKETDKKSGNAIEVEGRDI